MFSREDLSELILANNECITSKSRNPTAGFGVRSAAKSGLCGPRWHGPKLTFSANQLGSGLDSCCVANNVQQTVIVCIRVRDDLSFLSLEPS